MIVLDTNVLSELFRPEPDRHVLEWLDDQDAADTATTAVTSAELLYGAARLPAGRRRTALAAAITAVLDEDLAGRILPFDAVAAVHYAEIVTERERLGLPIGAADAQIAAICAAEDATLATRNIKDFQNIGIDLINPWTV